MFLSYVAVKNLNYVNIYSVDLLYLIIDEINGRIKESNRH